MVDNPPTSFPRVTPYLLYEDVPAALAWLSEAFGFCERLRFTAEDGTVNHAEMELADGVIMLGDPGGDYRNPRRAGAVTVRSTSTSTTSMPTVRGPRPRARPSCRAQPTKRMATAATTPRTPKATAGRSLSTSGTWRRLSGEPSRRSPPAKLSERVTGIEPASPAWKARPGTRFSRDPTPMAQVRSVCNRPLLTVRDRQMPVLRACGGPQD
jgi:hypothetical protein